MHHQFTILFCKSTTGGFLLKMPFKSIVILYEIQNFYINPLIIKWQYMCPDAPYFNPRADDAKRRARVVIPSGYLHPGKAVAKSKVHQ
jgi:hypothetical protein